MAHWIFTVSSQAVPGMAQMDVLTRRVGNGVWPLIRGMNFTFRLAAGDKVLFYFTKPECAFNGEAELAGPATRFPQSTWDKFRESDRITGESGVRLKSAKVWPSKLDVRPLVPLLDLFQDKAGWGAYLQGGIVRLSESDYETILRKRG